MTTTFLSREARKEASLLALQLLNPIGALAAGVIGLHYAVPAVLALMHGGARLDPQTVVIAWAIALVLGNVLVVVGLVLNGFGAPPTFTKQLVSNLLNFWLGMVLCFAAQVPPVGRWLEANTPFFDFAGTIMLCAATAFAFATGVVGMLDHGYQAAHASITALQVGSGNRAQHLALAGELFLCGGVARGVFQDRNLAVGAPRRGELLLYNEQSARRGTIAIGSPGSSKTRSKIYPDLAWGLHSSPKAGALVFVTKRRATQDCYAIANKFRPSDKIHVVGIGSDREHMDITSGMTHESFGDAIKDGLGASPSDFWRHGPSAFVEGFFELAIALAPATIRIPAQLDGEGKVVPGGEPYEFDVTDTLPAILKLISLDGRRLDAVFAYGFARAAELEPKDARKAAALRELLHEIQERVLPLMMRDAKLGEELRQSVLPQLQPFARGPLREAFSDPGGIDLGLLERGHVILVEVDETEHPRAVGTVVRMIFRRIEQMARERTASDRIGYLDPIILICDEYANYAAPGHIPAWNTVRESNICATVGITSVSALIKQLGGDRAAADAIAANFANKLFFEVDDKATRDLARELVGKSIVERRSKSKAASRSRGSSSSGHPQGGGGSNQSDGTSESVSINEHLEEVLDGSAWRSLGAGRDHATAIAFVRTPAGVKTDIVVLGVLDPTAGIDTASPEGYGLQT